VSTHDNFPALHAPAPSLSVGDLQTMAEQVAKSGLFAGINSPQAAFTLMLLCQAEGLHPAQALRRFHIIEGRPSMRADAMQAEFQKQRGTIRWLQSDAETCRAEFSHPVTHPEPVTIAVTLRELAESGVATSWDKERKEYTLKKNYRTSPAQMLRARAISQGVRMVLPGVVAGIYTPEEVGDFDPPPPPRPEAVEHVVPVAREEVEAPAPAKAERKDSRPFYRLVADGTERTNDEWRSDFPDAPDLVNGYQVSRHMLKFAIEGGAIGDPGTIKDGKVQALLNELYADPKHYLWMRRELASYLAAKLAEARERAALEDQDDGAIDDAGSVGAVLAEAREPGSDDA